MIPSNQSQKNLSLMLPIYSKVSFKQKSPLKLYFHKFVEILFFEVIHLIFSVNYIAPRQDVVVVKCEYSNTFSDVRIQKHR